MDATSGAVESAPPQTIDTLTLIAPDTSEFPAANDSVAHALDYAADTYFHSWEARADNGSLRFTRFMRTDSGLVAVPDTSSMLTDVGITRDSTNAVIGAIVATDAIRGDSGFHNYIFDGSGRTIVVELQYTDRDGQCGADIIDVTTRWVINAGRVVSRQRSLVDQDERSLAPHECLLGADTRIVAYLTWPALARSLGLQPTPGD